MGTTYLSAFERTEAFDDIDLLVAVSALVSEMDEEDRKALPNVFSEWTLALTKRGPGVLPLDLGLVCSTASRLSAFRRLLEKVDGHFAGLSDSVPLSQLRGYSIPGVEFHRDYPAKRVRAALSALGRLVGGLEKPGQNESE